MLNIFDSQLIINEDSHDLNFKVSNYKVKSYLSFRY